MRTEIDKDFRIERHKEYTVIGPFRTYADEEDKEEKKSELLVILKALGFVLFLGLPAICYCIGILFFGAE